MAQEIALDMSAGDFRIHLRQPFNFDASSGLVIRLSVAPAA